VKNKKSPEKISEFKKLITRAARLNSDNRTGRGVILDDRYCDEIFPGFAGADCWVARPVELPGSYPLEFEAGSNLTQTLRTWPSSHVAKCLVYYHPDDEEALRKTQLMKLKSLQDACIATSHEFLIEVIPPRGKPSNGDTLINALQQIYEFNIFPDWWKLPPGTSSDAWEKIAAVINHYDIYCRGVLLLGLEASEKELERSFEIAAAHPICKGFAVGRSIFAAAASDWFADKISDEQAVADIAQRYIRLIDLWHKARTEVNMTKTLSKKRNNVV
jgi:5-dehydro-2-deoxygluconokinase